MRSEKMEEIHLDFRIIPLGRFVNFFQKYERLIKILLFSWCVNFTRLVNSALGSISALVLLVWPSGECLLSHSSDLIMSNVHASTFRLTLAVTINLQGPYKIFPWHEFFQVCSKIGKRRNNTRVKKKKKKYELRHG